MFQAASEQVFLTCKVRLDVTKKKFDEHVILKFVEDIGKVSSEEYDYNKRSTEYCLKKGRATTTHFE